MYDEICVCGSFIRRYVVSFVFSSFSLSLSHTETFQKVCVYVYVCISANWSGRRKQCMMKFVCAEVLFDVTSYRLFFPLSLFLSLSQERFKKCVCVCVILWDLNKSVTLPFAFWCNPYSQIRCCCCCLSVNFVRKWRRDDGILYFSVLVIEGGSSSRLFCCVCVYRFLCYKVMRIRLWILRVIDDDDERTYSLKNNFFFFMCVKEISTHHKYEIL